MTEWGAWPFIGAFFGLLVGDLIFASYTRAVADGRPMKAAIVAAILYGVAVTVTVSIVNDYRLILPACAGAFVGTWIAVRWKL